VVVLEDSQSKALHNHKFEDDVVALPNGLPQPVKWRSNASVLAYRSIPLILVDHSILDPYLSQFLQSYKKKIEKVLLYENSRWSDMLKRFRSIGLH